MGEGKERGGKRKGKTGKGKGGEGCPPLGSLDSPVGIIAVFLNDGTLQE